MITTTQNKPLAVAHRGSAQHAIENTLPAFQQAVQDGADVLELDIHLTLDKDLAVIHDDTLERTHGNPGEVRKMTSQELRALGVPMLNDVLQLTQTPLFVEIKHPKGGRHEGIEQILVDQLDAAQADGRTTVISFDEESLKKVHELDPALPTGYLYSGRPIDMEKTRDELGITYLAPHFSLVNADYIEQAHSAGLKVDAWVVNRTRDMKRLADLHCDALTTDHIPELQGLLSGQPVQIPQQQGRLQG
ncbi:glycerophosphodiester phosphodiesterase [bacterium]|nr:glycerophosphodiester phosphodiesterase [bacterium]